MTPREHAKKLLEEWNLCVEAKPKNNAVDIRLDKDVVRPWAVHLDWQLSWGSENDIQIACCQLESRLNALKEKIIIEVLKNGSV